MVNRPNSLTHELRRADDDIATFEFGRSLAYQLSFEDWESMGIPAAANGERIWEAALRGENTTPLFLDDPAARTATLGILRLRGDWDASDAMQQNVVGPDSVFRKPPYEGTFIDRESPEAERIIAVNSDITSVYGLTTVTARRRLLETKRFTETLKIEGGRTFKATSHIEVDKVSTFALDIAKLNDIDPVAANEVRLIIVCGMLAVADLCRVHNAAMGYSTADDFKNGGLRNRQRESARIMRAGLKIKEYDINPDDVIERLHTEHMERIQRSETIAALQAEIKEPKGLLTPSTATFYGERVLHDLS